MSILWLLLVLSCCIAGIKAAAKWPLSDGDVSKIDSGDKYNISILGTNPPAGVTTTAEEGED